MSALHIGLTCLMTVVLLAIYWTLWKIRGEMIEGREKLKSDLSEMRKLVDKQAGGT